MSARTDFDVLIAGGGLVGAALAAVLATDPRARDLRVAVAEASPPAMPLPGEPPQLRVSALSRATQALLIAVGAWELLGARSPAPYRRMRVWDAAGTPDGPDALVFDAASIGEPDLGSIAENGAVAAALLAVAMRRGVSLLRAPVDGLELGADVATATIATRAVRAGLVVATDGARSALRALAGIPVAEHAYPQHALVSRLRPERDHDDEARQRFLPGGPLALLPLSDGSVSLVWSMPVAEAGALVDATDEAFAEAVTAASGGVLGRLAPLGPRASFALTRNHAATYVATRFALAGDAAHTVHPLAGQGANLGFADAAVLADTVLAARTRGEDPGDPRVLSRYSRARRADNLVVATAMEAIHRLFATTAPGIGALRRAGLGAVDRSGFLKARLMREALGLTAAWPERLRAASR